MEIEGGWMELLLKRHTKEKSVAKVLSVDKEPAVGKGENFSSDMLRIKMRVVLGSGEISHKSVILKKHPELQEGQNFLMEYHACPTEIILYSEIVPEMERLMLEYRDTSDKLWCDCLSYKINDYMILQDLKEAGFRNEGRMELLDLQHALFTVRNVARLHAMSAVLLHKGRLTVDRLQPYCVARNEKMMNQYLSSGMRMLARVIRTRWGSEWEEAANKVSKVSEDIGTRIQNLFHEKTKHLVVLNHGDCWVNNIMFKHELGTNIPTAIRFVDLQECHFNTFGWDLIYILKTSVRRADREKHLDDFLETYIHSLKSTFTFYGYTPDNLPTVEDVKAEIGRLSVYGFALSAVAVPMFMADTSDSMCIEDLMNEDDEYAMRHKMNMYIGDDFTEIIKEEVERFMAIPLG